MKYSRMDQFFSPLAIVSLKIDTFTMKHISFFFFVEEPDHHLTNLKKINGVSSKIALFGKREIDNPNVPLEYDFIDFHTSTTRVFHTWHKNGYLKIIIDLGA